MSRSAASLLILAAVMGCAPSGDEETTDTVGSELIAINEIGTIGNGEVRTGQVSTGNQAFRFKASHTDVVKASVTLSSSNGEAGAFILNRAQVAPLVEDDGSAPGNQAKVAFKVRRNSGAAPASNEFFFVFNDAAAAGGTYSVKLTTCDRATSGPNYESWRTYQPAGFNCESDFECPAGRFRFFNVCGCGCASEP